MLFGCANFFTLYIIRYESVKFRYYLPLRDSKSVYETQLFIKVVTMKKMEEMVPNFYLIP